MQKPGKVSAHGMKIKKKASNENFHIFILDFKKSGQVRFKNENILPDAGTDCSNASHPCTLQASQVIKKDFFRVTLTSPKLS